MSRPSRITIDDKFLHPSVASAAAAAAGAEAPSSPVTADDTDNANDEAGPKRALSSATLVNLGTDADSAQAEQGLAKDTEGSEEGDQEDQEEEGEEEEGYGGLRRSKFSFVSSGSASGPGFASGYSTAVNTPAKEHDAFIFPSSAPLSRATTHVPDNDNDAESGKGEEYELEGKFKRKQIGDDVSVKGQDQFADGREDRDSELERYVGELPSYPLPPPEKRGMSKGKMLVLGGVMMSTTFVASATNSATLLSIPSTAADLGVSELQAQWVSSAYALANGCGLLFAGRLADLYGKKFLYLFGMATYIILSIISGVLRNFVAICVIRAFAGVAIAISLPAAFGIIGVTFDAEPYRTMAFSALALGYPLGGGPGLIIAGVVAGVNRHAWQYVFFILSGLAVIPLVLGAITIPNVPRDVAKDKASANRRIDWLGAFLITAALSLFSFALTQSGLVEDGWQQPYIGACLGLSIVLVIAFGFWEHFAAHKTNIPPLVHLSIFTRREWKVTSVLCLSFFGYLGISGWLYLTTIWYQSLKSESALLDAIHMLPAPMIGMGACIVVPLLAPRVRAPYLLAFGGLSTGVATMLFAVGSVNMTYWANSFLSNVFAPFGADFTVGIGSVLMSNLVAGDEQSTAGALFQTALQLAATLGTCICSLISTDVSQTAGLEKGLKDAFWTMSAFCWCSAVIALVTLRKVGLAKDVGKM